jgi:hypothetical protein
MDELRAKIAALGIEGLEGVLENFHGVMQEQQAQIDHFHATPYCTIREALDSEWQPYAVEDYTSIVRDWTDFSARISSNAELLDVYNRTRTAAMNTHTVASHSQALMYVGDVAPVRLCSFPGTANFADKAHLRPKTAVSRKCDTWIYAAAAGLEMPWNTPESRLPLIKAVCGSCRIGNQVNDSTGLT